MATGADNLDVALRITADVNSARAGVAGVRAEVEGLSTSAGKSTRATRAQTAALADLLGQIDPVGAKLGKFDELESKLGKFSKAGLLGAEDFGVFSAKINASRDALTRTNKAVHKFSFNSANARREFGFLAKDLATGQYGRLTQSSLTLANYSGLLSKAFSAQGVAILGVAGVLVGLAAAYVKGLDEQEKLNAQIKITGNYAGQTAGSVDAMAQSIAGTGVGIRDARTALSQLIATGRFTARPAGHRRGSRQHGGDHRPGHRHHGEAVREAQGRPGQGQRRAQHAIPLPHGGRV